MMEPNKTTIESVGGIIRQFTMLGGKNRQGGDLYFFVGEKNSNGDPVKHPISAIVRDPGYEERTGRMRVLIMVKDKENDGYERIWKEIIDDKVFEYDVPGFDK
jgi:hypothetical protein